MLNSNSPNFNSQGPASNHPNSEVSSEILDAISAYTDKRKKPKRNRSAFILFSIDIRKQLKPKELDNLNPNDKFVKIAELWENISEKERKHYEERAREEKDRYTSELNDFRKVFPTEPIQRPRNHIKKPCNAYGFYLKDIKESIRKDNPELRMCEVLRIVGERWKNLRPDEKQIYEKKAEISRKNFKAAVSKQLQAAKGVEKQRKGSSTTKEKEESPEVSRSTRSSLVLKDPFLDELEAKTKKIKKSPPNDSPILPGSKHADQENILPNLTQPLLPENPSNLMIPELAQQNYYSNLNRIESFMDRRSLLPLAALTSLQMGLLNKEIQHPLADLYWKVEQLRQQILGQLQSLPNPRQILLSSLTNLQMLGQVNLEALREQPNNFASRFMMNREEMKDESK